MKNENKMQRGAVQAIYNYLPKSHIDFHIRSTRTTLAARVKYWKTEVLYNINHARVYELIRENLSSFEGAGGLTKGFAPTFDEKLYQILTPSLSEEGAVISAIHPLTFVCTNCKRAHTFKTVSDYRSLAEVTRECCKHNLNQLMFTYPCECGFCGGIQVLRCPEHPRSDMLCDNNNYKFICAECNNRVDMRIHCPECKKPLSPHAALDRSNMIAATITMIDLYNSSEEKFLAEADYANSIIISKWLNLLNNKDYKMVVSGADEKRYKSEQAVFLQKKQEYIDLGIDKDSAESLAKSETVPQNSSVTSRLVKKIDSILSVREQTALHRTTSQILEFERVLKSNSLITLEEAEHLAAELKPNLKPGTYAEAASKLGFSRCYYTSDIPFIVMAYGYTRRSDDPAQKAGLTLRSFKIRDSSISNIYGIKMKTDGILFELDMEKIIRWLVSNEIINEIQAPDPKNESDLKRWFIDNVNMAVLSKFNEIDEKSHQITAAVYKLIHSVSHALIKKTGICGLDEGSIGEYLLPNTASFILYCKNTGGISIGALASLFKVHFHQWLINTFEDIERCIADPICIERDKACNGCLLISSTSCQHQNRDLNRAYLCGLKSGGQAEIKGFWK